MEITAPKIPALLLAGGEGGGGVGGGGANDGKNSSFVLLSWKDDKLSLASQDRSNWLLSRKIPEVEKSVEEKMGFSHPHPTRK